MAERSSGGIAAERLKSFIERIERLEEEKRALKTMRQIIRIRRLDEQDRDEQEALLDTYMRALGMLPQRGGRRAAG